MSESDHSIRSSEYVYKALFIALYTYSDEGASDDSDVSDCVWCVCGGGGVCVCVFVCLHWWSVFVCVRTPPGTPFTLLS